MFKDTENKLARSLTAETIELLPFLPYLLQDLWELGSNPRDMLHLLSKHLPISTKTKILDLACGKGAVAITIAGSLNIKVDGFDLMPAFIAYAKDKAKEMNVSELCCFTHADVNEVVKVKNSYDCVVFGAAGNILGAPETTLNKLRGVVRPGGYILIDEAYALESFVDEKIKYKNYDYLTRIQWLQLFESAGLRLVEEVPNSEEYNFDADNKAIAMRAEDLIAMYPEKRTLFEGYLRSQLNECDDLENSIMAVTWLLQRF